MEQLEALRKFYEAGFISEEEYSYRKNQLIDKFTSTSLGPPQSVQSLEQQELIINPLTGFTATDKEALAADIAKLDVHSLEKVVQLIDARSLKCSQERENDEVFDLDELDNPSLSLIQSFVHDCLEGTDVPAYVNINNNNNNNNNTITDYNQVEIPPTDPGVPLIDSLTPRKRTYSETRRSRNEDSMAAEEEDNESSLNPDAPKEAQLERKRKKEFIGAIEPVDPTDPGSQISYYHPMSTQSLLQRELKMEQDKQESAADSFVDDDFMNELPDISMVKVETGAGSYLDNGNSIFEEFQLQMIQQQQQMEIQDELPKPEFSREFLPLEDIDIQSIASMVPPKWTPDMTPQNSLDIPSPKDEEIPDDQLMQSLAAMFPDILVATDPNQPPPPGKMRIKIQIYRVEKSSNGNKPYQCDAPGCTKAFSDSSNLLKHLRTHTGEKPYACSFEGCTKSYAHSSTLKEHTNTHTGSKPYVCSYPGCGKQFAQNSNLRRHTRVHTGDKPYVCEECGRSFTQSTNMRQHQLTHVKQNNSSESQKNNDIQSF